jgi:hypothetical protein
LESFAATRDTVVWVDHPEAPSLTPRHPLDVDRFLWGLREMLQRLERLSLVVSARDAFDSELLGRERAFYEQGRWLTIDNPAPPTWSQVGADLGAPSDLVRDLVGLTGGHPATMLRGLAAADSDSPRPASDIIVKLASTSIPLAARAVQHARSLHRLGGQVLIQVARGQRPYAAAQKGDSPPQEIRRVLGRLHLAGLIRHDPGSWSIVDPLVGAVLRGEVGPAAADDLV